MRPETTTSDRAARLWPATVDDVIGGDLTVVLASVTPAQGVTLLPVTNFAIRDAAAGTYAGVNSSVGVSTKLQRIRANPKVAVAFHAREHGWSRREEFVLLQGTATLSAPTPRFMEAIPEEFARVGGEPAIRGPISARLFSAWHLRVGLSIDVERIIAWPDLRSLGEPAVYGRPLAAEGPRSQSPPKNGTGPRVSARRSARRLRSLEHILLGWVDADGFPTVAPVRLQRADERGLVLSVPPHVAHGCRRAGLVGHRFRASNVGFALRSHTGWLEIDGDALYAPHTASSLTIPPSRTAYKIMAAAGTWWGLRKARKAGFIPNGEG